MDILSTIMLILLIIATIRHFIESRNESRTHLWIIVGIWFAAGMIASLMGMVILNAYPELSVPESPKLTALILSITLMIIIVNGISIVITFIGITLLALGGPREWESVANFIKKIRFRKASEDKPE